MKRQTISIAGGEKYCVEDVLGTGGMGIVYLARDLSCGRPIALKLIAENNLHSDSIAQFVREACVTADLEHPNIVPVHELGQDTSGRFYYTMKCVNGITLADILIDLRKGNQAIIRDYPLERLLTIFLKVCDAVAFAHSKGIIHKDLKPANVMVGSYGEVVVLDWGLARYLNGDPDAMWSEEGISCPFIQTWLHTALPDEVFSETNALKRNSVEGTPGYIAPEMIDPSNGCVDQLSDIYALGGLLYSILTLKPSVRDPDVGEMIRRILAGDITAPEDVPLEESEVKHILHHCRDGHIPPELSDMVMKAMSVQKELRYQTVREFQEDIERYQQGMAWHLIYEMPANDLGATLHWTAAGGTLEYVGNALRISGGAPQVLLFRQALQGNIRFEFECRIDSEYLNDVGCFISAEPSEDITGIPQTGYEFKYGAHGNKLSVLTREQRILWMQQHAPLRKGELYQVMAERMGNSLRMTVNGRELFHIADNKPLTGPTRTAVGLLGWMSDTYYTGIKIHTLGVPWKHDVLDLAEQHFTKRHYSTALDLFQDVMDSFPVKQRLQAAREGYKRARSCQYAEDHLNEWKERVEQAWPGRHIRMEVTQDGLRVMLAGQQITRLDPLKGMPISVLDCSGNQIESLAPLQDMPLTSLNCGRNPISDLTPLKGMALTQFYCESCRIVCLDALAGMPLVSLNSENNPLDGNLTPLKNMPLDWLSCVRCHVSDLSPLRGMTLKALYCDCNQISTIEPLNGMPLLTLTCSGNTISNLSPLRGTRLTTLHAGANQIRDLSPLAEMPLTMLSIQQNNVENLDPLTALPLSVLTCGANRFLSIGKLVNHPPETFLYDSESLSMEEMQWLLQRWSSDFRYQRHAEDARLIIASRKKDSATLKQMARRDDHGRYYLIIPRFMTWDAARTYCEDLGGHLLTIRSESENNFVNRMFPGGCWFWMGLFVDETGPRWVTGYPVEYTALVDGFKRLLPGPKVYTCGHWTHDLLENAVNPFMIEWD